MESAGGIFSGIPAEAQRDHQQAGWTEQFGKDAERPLPALRRHVHPHGTQQDQIEPAPERAQGSQIRQRVVHSDNAVVRIAGGPIAQGARFQRVVARKDGVPVTIVVSGPVHADSTVGMRLWSRLVRINATVATRTCGPPALSIATGFRKGSSAAWARAWMRK